MGDLSEHFNHRDFICKCESCSRFGRDREYKIHLGLVGILEEIESHFKQTVNVLSAFWCNDFCEKQKKEARSFHAKGKAVHFNIKNIPLSDIFKYAETIPEINGIGLYPKEGFIHIDTRPKDKRALWIKESSHHTFLTPEKRKQYNL